MKKLISIMAATIIAVASVPATAAEVPVASSKTHRSVITFAGSEEITPYADVIKVVFRTYNGKRQMRRWNQTWGYWVDPAWITIGS